MCLEEEAAAAEAVEEGVEEARAPQEKQPAPATPWVLAKAKEMGGGMDS